MKIIRLQPQIIYNCEKCVYSHLKLHQKFLHKTTSSLICTAHRNREGENLPVSKLGIPEWCQLEEYNTEEHEIA